MWGCNRMQIGRSPELNTVEALATLAKKARSSRRMHLLSSRPNRGSVLFKTLTTPGT